MSKNQKLQKFTLDEPCPPAPSPDAEWPTAPLPAAVLIERFEAKIAAGGVFLTLFGLGVRKEGAPLEQTPAMTAYLSGMNAADLSKVLATAVAALKTLAVDNSNPQ